MQRSAVTIVAANTAPTGQSDCALVAMVASDHNISGDGSCMFTDAGSKQSTDPLLGASQNNGGETDTLALQAGSPAIDAGTNDGCPGTDQRGVARSQGPSCDIARNLLHPSADQRVVFIGDDLEEIALEVVAVEEDEEEFVVIHAMNMRKRFRGIHKEARRWAK